MKIFSSDSFVNKFLTNSIKKNRLPQSMIFTGLKNNIKLNTALNIAKSVFCTEDDFFCDSCYNCNRVNKQIHLDMIVVSPKGNSIPKEDITNIHKEVSMKSSETNSRIIIIDDANLLTSSASNSLLKIFEEPSVNTYSILICEDENDLLDTIKSRAQLLFFKSKSSVHRENVLDNYNVPDIQKDIFRNLVCKTDDIEYLLELTEFSLLKKYVHTYLNKLKFSVEDAFIWFMSAFGYFYNDKKYLEVLFNYLIQVLKVLVKEQNSTECALTDYYELKELNYTNLISNLEVLSESYSDITSSLNVNLVIDNILLNFKRL